MNEEELKAGERYNFTLLYTGQSINNKFRFESPTGIHYILGLGDMEAVSPVSAHENGINNTESAPKYDPCRLFRKGDIVKVKEDIDGRNLHAFTTGLTLGKLYTVEEDEKGCKLKIKNDDGYGIYAFVHFKLVTPVEELEPYGIIENLYGWIVFKDSPGNVMANFNNTHPNAKAAADAECARLNAEHRKERK